MAMNMTEKILARTSGQATVGPGDLVVCEVDRSVMYDLNFYATRFEKDICRLHDPAKVAIVLDHAVPAPTIADAANHKRAREFAARLGIQHFYDLGSQGICHQVIAEQALALPGQLLACGDSHSCAAGAFNCAARGMGSEMVSILCTGKTWFRVGTTVRYSLTGELPERVSAKDLFLHIAGTYGDHANTNVEFGGHGVQSLTMMQRHTISAMCAEISADFALFPADGQTHRYLEERNASSYEPVASDPDASYSSERTIDLGSLEPAVALPHNVVKNVRGARDLGEVRIDQAFVGSCANGKLEDIGAAACMIKGKRVAAGVRLIVTPSSQAIYLEAVRAGYVETLLAAGAVVTNSTCGACAGLHMGVLGPGERCITSSTRNFQGRMGSPDAEIFMASSETVTASAIRGVITDPREV